MDDPRLKFDFCVSSFETNPLSKTSDISGLAVISMDLCSKNATYIGKYIDSILKDGKAEPSVIKNLKDCIEYYSYALEDVQEAMKAFNGKYYNEGIDHMNNAHIWADTCKQGFIDLGVDFSPLRKQDNDFFQLTNISLNIIAIIRGP
ncbi:pectinesterase inhibitor 12-like [Papaver somniferum]|uniref:pectinesterase inhibitor 12-like n=1 Tax=Papaver somniferum TaxID=3469 RepID=UPI000E705C62|nr:pectinesterase inhibitor 12-like [Papaver somniferum]